MIEYARLDPSTQARESPTVQRLEPHQIDTHGAVLRGGVWLCGGCTVRVTARRSYRRADGARVLAHFATWPSADRAARHDPGCPFEPPERDVPEPVTEPMTPTADETTMSLSEASTDGVAAYGARWLGSDREWVLEGVDERSGRESANGSPHGDAPDGPRSGRNSRSAAARGPGPGGRSGRLTTARDVLELVRHFGRHPLDLSRFSARWGSGAGATRLTWGDLYYPPGRHHLLLARTDSADLPPHPVAVAGRMAHLSVRPNRRHGGEDTVAYLELPAPLRDRHRLVVRIGPGADQPERWRVHDDVHDDGATRLLVVARLEAFTPAGDGSPTYCTAWVGHHGQLIVLDADEAID